MLIGNLGFISLILNYKVKYLKILLYLVRSFMDIIYVIDFFEPLDENPPSANALYFEKVITQTMSNRLLVVIC